jgi:hypothetical protein
LHLLVLSLLILWYQTLIAHLHTGWRELLLSFWLDHLADRSIAQI